MGKSSSKLNMKAQYCCSIANKTHTHTNIFKYSRSPKPTTEYLEQIDKGGAK